MQGDALDQRIVPPAAIVAIVNIAMPEVLAVYAHLLSRQKDLSPLLLHQKQKYIPANARPLQRKAPDVPAPLGQMGIAGSMEDEE
jgi:hypothetical protein